MTGGWLNIIHLLTFKLKDGQLIFKKQLEHFWDDSIDPLNFSMLQPRTIIMRGMLSEGVKIFQLVTPTHQIKIIQNIYNVLNDWTLTHMGIRRMILNVIFMFLKTNYK